MTRSSCASNGLNAIEAASEESRVRTTGSPARASRRVRARSGSADAAARKRPSREKASAVTAEEAHPSSEATGARVSSACTRIVGSREPDSAYATSPPSTLTAKHEMARPTPHRKRDVDEDVS